MLQFWDRFLHDMHFVRAFIVGVAVWGGLALVSPVGRERWEKALYTLPVAMGVSVASVSGSNGKPKE